MSLKRFEFLVNEVRESTDTKDINSLGVYELMRYFNDGQKLIQKIIFTSNPSADIFVKPARYAMASGQYAYDLPFDIYAHSSVTSVQSINGEDVSPPLTRLASRERNTLSGYYLLDRQFVLTSAPSASAVSEIQVNYVYKLPNLSYRLGQVDSFDPLTGAVIVSGSTIVDDTSFTDRYDEFSIVNSKGVQVANELDLTSFAGLGFTFSGTLDADTDKGLAGVSIGDWVVCGGNGTSHSCLPEACEPFLTSYVQRRILAKIASTEITAESAFTDQERMDLEDLFKDTVKDALYPVSADTDYLGY